MTQLSTPTYANAIRGLVETFRPLTTKPTASADMQEKDIFVSLKNTNKSSSLISTPATILTDKANAMLIEFFKNLANGG